MFLATHRFALLLVAALVVVAPASAKGPKGAVPVKAVVVVSEPAVKESDQFGKAVAPREPIHRAVRRSGGTMMERY
ncbi:MAG: hypothetical protein ACI80V_002324 [Rhodothermales bacterium]|jgi:hypothetical protein